MSGSRALRIYIVVATAAIASFALAPNPSLATLSDLAVTVTAVVGCAVGLRRHRPDRPGPWRWMLLSLSAALGGTVVWIALEAADRDPTVARILYVGAYGAAAVGVWKMVRNRSGHDRVDGVLASGLVAAAAAIVAWLFLVQPLAAFTGPGGTGHALRTVFPVASFGLAVMMIRFLSGRAEGLVAHWLVTAGLVCFFLAEVAEVAGLGGVDAGGATATVRLVAYGFIGMATLHPSVRTPMEAPADGASYRLSRPELAAVVFAGVAGPVSLVIRLDAATRVELAVIGVGSAVLVVLVVARLWRLLTVLAASTQRESEDRFRALVENAGDVICVVAPSGEVLYVSPTSERVWGYAPETMAASAFGMIVPEDRRRVRRLVEQLVAGPPGAIARLEGDARHADGSMRRFEAVYANRIDDPAIDGIVITSRDVTDRYELEQRLWRRAFIDQLTGLPNRSLLIERITAALESAEAGRRLGLLVLDLDDFKTVNDSLGRQRGDELLRTVADRLEALGGPGTMCARLAGDTFAVLVPDAASEDVDALAASALAVAARSVTLAGRRFEPRASIGVATSQPETSADELVRAAEAAMHVAKRDARGSIRSFDPGMHAEAVRRLQLRMDLGSAAERGQLWVAYQPIHELRTGRMAGVEALLRWDHPVRGSVSPAEFIPLAEGSGTICALGEFVLRQACQDVAAHRATTRTDVTVSVNLSPAQLVDPALPDMVASALKDSDLPAARLTLEVTEGVFLEHSAGVIDALSRLRMLGVRLAIDDFGTGYCALGYLTKFRFDIVKIDRSFISVLDVPDADRRVTMGILELVASLEVPAVAEGIETPEQLDALRAAGCEYGQGFHWSRPVPIEEIPGATSVVSDEPAAEDEGAALTSDRLT